MAITDSYATAQEARRFFRQSSDRSDDFIDAALAACSRFYESRTHQFFTKNASPVARIWYGEGTNVLKVYGNDNCPGIADVTGMTVKLDTGLDGTFATTYTSDMYNLEPSEALVGPEPSPYKELVIPYWSTAPFRFWPKPIRQAYGVQVTAIYGWPSVPAMVKQDVIKLCGIWLNKLPESTGHINELDQVVGMSPIAGAMVKRWQEAHYEPIFA